MDIYEPVKYIGLGLAVQASILGGMLAYYKILDIRGRQKYSRDMKSYIKGELKKEPKLRDYTLFTTDHL